MMMYLHFVALCGLVLIHGNCFGQNCEMSLVASESPKVIKTPNYPNNYDNHLSCTWSITVETPGAQVEVDFENILTEACCDYVLVRDGPSLESQIVANFRGNMTKYNFVSSFGAFYITFVSDDSITRTGFQFTYAEVMIDNSCGRRLKAGKSMKNITLQNMLLPQPTTLYCVWTILAPKGMQVQLFLREANLKPFVDSMLIRDGRTDASPILANLREPLKRSGTVMSSNGVLQLRFRSHSTENSTGFSAYYRAAARKPFRRIPQLPSIIECGGHLEATIEGPAKHLLSPDYPKIHASNLMCSWLITAPEGKRVRLWFAYVNTEKCCDWLKIRDGIKTDSPKLGVISGYPMNFNNYVSTGNNMRVEFDSDSSINSRGFSAFYEVYKPENNSNTAACGGIRMVDQTIQYISSPGWPNEHTHNLNCTWVLKASTLNATIRFHLLGTITQTHRDNLKIYNGNSTKSSLSLVISGKHYNRYVITSSGQYLTVNFSSDSKTAFGGFRASYTEVNSGSGRYLDH